MSIRITFGNRGQIFSKLTKTTFKLRDESLQSLTLNQYRELCAFFFGYRSYQEVKKANITDINARAVAFDTLDALTFNKLQERAEELAIGDLEASWPLSSKAPFSELPLANIMFWSSFSDPLYHTMLNMNAHLKQYLCIPIFSSCSYALSDAMALSSSIEEKYHEFFGIDIEALPDKVGIQTILPESLNDYECPSGFDFSDKKVNQVNRDCGEVAECNFDSPLYSALYCTELWFEASRPISDDCKSDLEDLRQYVLQSLSVDNNGGDLLSVMTPVAFDRDEITSEDEVGYRNYQGIYASHGTFSLHTINQHTLEPDKEKVLLLGHHGMHAGYLVFNDTDAQYFLPSADKLNVTNDGARDELFCTAFEYLQEFSAGFKNIAVFDVADLFENNRNSAYTHWDMGVDCLPQGTLKSPPKRRSSHYDGTIISMPRYHQFDEDYWGADIDDDEAITSRHMPTAAYFYQGVSPDTDPSPFFLEVMADELDGEDDVILSITKIIRHNDGAFAMYIANLYDEHGLITSESFTIYDRIVQSPHRDTVGGRACPVIKRLRNLAKANNWACIEVECEYEWQVTTLGGMEVMAGHSPELAKKKNKRVIALSVLTHQQVSPVSEQGFDDVANALKSALLKYTPHNAEMVPRCNVHLIPDRHMYWIKKCPYLKIDSIGEAITQTAFSLLESGDTQHAPSDLQTETPQRGPCTLYFTLSGSVSDMNEINAGFGTLMMASAFGGAPRREANEICQTEFPQQRSNILSAFGLDSRSDNMIIIDFFQQ